MFDLSRLLCGVAYAQAAVGGPMNMSNADVAGGANPNAKYVIGAVFIGLVYFLFFHKKKSK